MITTQSETTWAITNAGGSVVASGTYGSQADGSTSILRYAYLMDATISLSATAMATVFAAAYGNGSYTVSQGGTTLASGGSFTTSQTTNICIGGVLLQLVMMASKWRRNWRGLRRFLRPCATCDDGIQNGDETGVDCGGSCALVAEAAVRLPK
ncbi:MAG: hypothetical protein R2795_12050 [Saprospiraceae bacterium]